MAPRTTGRVAPALGTLALGFAVTCTDSTGPEEFTCEAPDIAVGAWTEATGPGIRFLLPTGFVPGGGGYTFGRAWIRFEVVPPGQRPDEPEFEIVNYRSCSIDIGGKSAFLENGTTRGGTGNIGEGFYIAATWSNVILGPLSPPQHLVMSGFAIERDVLLEIFRAIHTVEFTFTGPVD